MEHALPGDPLIVDWHEPLSRYIESSQTASVPEDIEALARSHLLDTIAAIVACRDLRPAAVARDFMLKHSAAADTSIILGTLQRCALLDSIMASAMTAHAAEINDFCPSAFVQPGAAVVPTVLCIAQSRGMNGGATLRAMIAGYEIACRLPKAVGIGNLQRSGVANHSLGAMFGSAVGAASLIGLPRSRIDHMFAYCMQQAGGSWQWLRDVDHIEKAFVFGGMPARRGAECALFAEAGFTGVAGPLSGAPGWLSSEFLRSAESDFAPHVLIDGLGERFELPLVAYKKYPVGGPTQPVVELMLRLVGEVDAHSVRHVRIEMPGRTAAFASAAMPALNLPYLCAIILLDGKLDFVAAQSRERFLHDTAVAALMPHVEVIHDPAQEAKPRVESARVTLTLADGKRVSAFLDHVKGFPAHPMDAADVEEKALSLMVPHLGTQRARDIVACIAAIDELSDVNVLTRLMAR